MPAYALAVEIIAELLGTSAASKEGAEPGDPRAGAAAGAGEER